jgi:hypothetical protein
MVDYDNAGALQFAGSTGYNADKNGVGFAIILISGISPLSPRPVSATDKRLVCDQADEDWITDSLFVAKDRDGVLKCLHDFGWGWVRFWAETGLVDTTLDPLQAATPPLFREPPEPDACWLANGDNLCVMGTIVTCDNPPLGGDIHACTGQDANHPVGNQWTIVTDVGDPSANPPILLTAKVVNGLRSQVMAGSHKYVGQYGIDVLVVVAQVSGGTLANQYPPMSSSDLRQMVTMQLILRPGQDSSDPFWDWSKSFHTSTHDNFATHLYATDGSNP